MTDNDWELVVPFACGCEVAFYGPRLLTSRMLCCPLHNGKDDFETRNRIGAEARKKRDAELATHN